MEFIGSVEEVVYRNNDNGYSVIRMFVKGYDAPQTCVGYFPVVMPGENLVINGEWTMNKMFGKQIEVKSAQIELPTTNAAMIKYLSSGLFRGIGPTLAQRIVEKYKDKTFEVIEFAPTVLSTIKTISYNKAVEISEAFKSHKNIQRMIMYLQAYDISINLALKLYNVYKEKLEIILETNPYQLIKDVDGIGFLKADDIAQKIGIDKESHFRLSAGIQYVLMQNANTHGHTYMTKERLVESAQEVLKLDIHSYQDIILNAIKQCEKDNAIVLLDEDNIVMSKYYYELEKNISKKLVALLNSSKNTVLTDVDEDIKNYQRLEKISLHENQAEAIKNAIMYGVSIITGGPGTGKTTIVKAIIRILESLGLKVCLCAPTGRASRRLEEATNREAKTIHRLLKLNFDTGTPIFEFNERNPLDADVIICDEISMCDEGLFFCLLSALKKGARFIMLGDKDQLPSVGAGNVLMDLIFSKTVPISYLTKIFRQNLDSSITISAHDINSGKVPKTDNKSKDFFFLEETDPEGLTKTVKELVKERLTKAYGYDLKDMQVLSPIKRGLCGVENLNTKLQNSINRDYKDELVKGNLKFRTNDRVIHVENNYSLSWYNEEDNTIGQGVFNGEMGFIEQIWPREKRLSVRFDDGKVVKYTSEEISQLNLAYAISVHKSQGSEFKAVIMVMPTSYMPIMTRNLLYTGITRAKEMVVIVGSKENFKRTIFNNTVIKRNTKLIQFLNEEWQFYLD